MITVAASDSGIERRRALHISAHQSGSLITAESSVVGRQGCDLRKLVRRVGIEPTTRWLGVA